MTIELMDIVYFKIQADWKIFHVDPISFEIQEPDWESGQWDEI